MLKLFLIFLLLLSTAYAEDKNSLPLFGSMEKTPLEKETDTRFIKEAIAAAGTEEAAVSHLLSRGWQAIEKFDPVTAIKRFNQVYLLSPEEYQVYWGIGAALGQQRKFEESIKFFEKAVARKSNDARLIADKGFAHVYFGISLMGMPRNENLVLNQLAQAEGLYKQALELDPKLALAYSRLAVLSFYNGKFKESREFVEKSRSLGGEGLDPRFVKDLESQLARGNTK